MMDLEQPEFFNLVQFFRDGSYEYVRRLSTLSELEPMIQRCTEGAEARSGNVARVILTDMENFTRLEWVNGRGIVWPRSRKIDITSSSSPTR